MPPRRRLELSSQVCNKCLREWSIDDFYKIKSTRYPNGITGFCKECINDIMNDNLKKHKSMEASIYFCCALIDVPFIRRVYEGFEDKISTMKSKTINYMGIYLSLMETMRKKTDKWNEFSDSNIELGQIKKLRKHEKLLEDEMEELKLIWGEKTLEQLEYLEYRYTVYTDNKNLTEYQSKLYRSLCLAELQEYENDDVDRAVTRQGKIAQTLGIDKFNIEKEKTADERMLEVGIAKIEREKPAFHYKDKERYTDFMGFEEYFNAHIKRPFSNFLQGNKEYKIKPNINIVEKNTDE